jgi:ATP-dependent DNA ligase
LKRKSFRSRYVEIPLTPLDAAAVQRLAANDRQLAAHPRRYAGLASMPGRLVPTRHSSAATRGRAATLKPKPPSGDAWIHEIKFDGYRSQVSNAGAKIFTAKD